MTLDELQNKSILILGFGTEGQATYDFVRKRWPDKLLTIADQQSVDAFSEDVISRINNDPAIYLLISTPARIFLFSCTSFLNIWITTTVSRHMSRPRRTSRDFKQTVISSCSMMIIRFQPPSPHVRTLNCGLSAWNIRQT